MTTQQPVLAAIDFSDAADEALRHVRLRTQALPPVLDYEAATIVQKEYEIVKGDVDAAMARARWCTWSGASLRWRGFSSG